MAEPWRDGAIKHFNRHYGQKFFARIPLRSVEALPYRLFELERKHSVCYRYRKLNGQTPNLTPTCRQHQRLRFPPTKTEPRHPLPKPQAGRYHLIRFIRSDGQLGAFGEHFTVPADLHYENVVATIDVKEQRLKLFLGHVQAEEFDHQLR